MFAEAHRRHKPESVALQILGSILRHDRSPHSSADPGMYTSLWRRCRFHRRPPERIDLLAQRLAGGFRHSRRWRRLRGRFARHDSTTPFQAATDPACRGWPGICGALLFLLWRRSLNWFLAVDVFVFDVAMGVGVYGRLIGRR